MNKSTYYIAGICEGNVAIKGELVAGYFNGIRQLIVNNKPLTDLKLSAAYLFDSILGIVNLKYTLFVKRERLDGKASEVNFDELMQYLTVKLCETELKLAQKAKKSISLFSKTINVKHDFEFANIEYLSKEFDDILRTREEELSILKAMMESNSMVAFQRAYFDMALDIINKSKIVYDYLSETEVQEYAKDIFSEAVLKLVSLFLEGKYVYEAKISSFLYWPMFNKWVKISKGLGITLDDNITEQLPDEDRIYYDDNMEREELMRFLKENFDKLNQRERQVLWMKEVEGYSYQEIKEILGLDEEINYLKQIKLRGKKNLEKSMQKDSRLQELLY